MADGESSAARPVDESTLCRACGLCCQGQLFSWVALEPGEVERARGWPVELMTHGEGQGFRQPCGCFREMRCTVYAERPKACVAFRCRLLNAFRDGAVDGETALARIAQARALFDEIEARLPADARAGIWDRITARWDLDRLRPLLERGEIDEETLMAIVGLDALLSKHFRTKPRE